MSWWCEFYTDGTAGNSNKTTPFQQLINNIIIASTVKYKLLKTLFFTLQSLFHVIFFFCFVSFIQWPFFLSHYYFFK